MRYFQKIDEGIDVTDAIWQLDQHPEVWDRDRERIDAPNSPHVESSDIWLRFRPRRDLNRPASFGEPHFAEFYPAWHVLTALHPVVFRIMNRVEATYLGGCLITKIPAGKSIHPHIDRGWHPETMGTKVYVILAANDQCLNRCAGETVVLRPGEAWTFRNDVLHSVKNGGETDRIAVILTMRID